MPYSLLVLDAGNRLVDFNPAARSLPQGSDKLTLRKSVSQQLPGWWKKLEKLLGDEPTSKDITSPDPEREQIYRVTSVPLKQASGSRMGHAFLLEDVTQARRVEQLQTQTQRAMATLQERERLARELHDELAQELALINLQAQLAKDMLALGQVEQAREQLQILASEALRAQVDVRDEISKLLHRIAEGEDFLGALKRILQAFQKTNGINVQVDLTEDETDIFFEPATEVQLLRIVQEALTNIRKHARATSVKVELTRESDSTQMVIEDNGVGFDTEHLLAGQQSYGLGIISERAKEFQGRVSVDSTPGQGTRIVVKIPDNENGRLEKSNDGEA
jgi:signal transduction histidine kinase